MSISRIFLVDQMRLANNDRMTTVEVRQRVQENMGTLAPILGNANTDLFMVIVARSFNIANRMGLLPPPPKDIGGQRLTLKFSNPLAKTQRLTEVQGLVSAMDVITPMANVDPSILKVFNADRFARATLDAYGAPMDVMNSPEEIQAQEAKEQQQQDTAIALQQAQALSGSVKDIASATKDYAGAQQTRGGSPFGM